MKYDIIIYADGGCRNNQSKNNIGGWGAFIKTGTSLNVKLNGYEENTTNNKMELKACIEALREIKLKVFSVLVVVDSKYVCDGINKWIYGWIRRDWKTSQYKPVKNKELWVELKGLVDEFKNIRFEWTRGHAGDVGNEIADELVNKAMDNKKGEINYGT